VKSGGVLLKAIVNGELKGATVTAKMQALRSGIEVGVKTGRPLFREPSCSSSRGRVNFKKINGKYLFSDNFSGGEDWQRGLLKNGEIERGVEAIICEGRVRLMVSPKKGSHGGGEKKDAEQGGRRLFCGFFKRGSGALTLTKKSKGYGGHDRTEVEGHAGGSL